jgi:Zn-dependent protease/CBS domain-containing protein
MGKSNIHLGRILGIPIGLDLSWFLIFALMTWTLAVSYFPAEYRNWPVALYWITGALTAIFLFVSVLLHELGHSVVAMHYKIPVKSITLFIFGGIAQIGSEPPSAISEFWIAIAGPLVSFTLALIFTILKPLSSAFSPVLALVTYMAYINGTLGLFNLIPGFPLDGGRVFRAIVWGFSKNFRRATLIAGNVGRGVAFLFIIYGVWMVLTGNLVGGLWIAFIGWFLESAANSQVQQQQVHDLLANHTVSQVMSSSYSIVPSYTTIQDLVDDQILNNGRRSFIVEEGDYVVGLLTLHRVRQVPRSEWGITQVSRIMIPIEQAKLVEPDTELWKALEEMDRDGYSQLPVMFEGRVAGMLTRDGIITFLRTLQQLGA